MKKIVAIIGALLFSAFAGVAYVAPKYDDFYFGETAYYHVSEEEVLYKQLYQSVYGSDVSSADRCDTTRVQENRDEWVSVDTHDQSFSSVLWDPVYVDDTVTVETGTNTITYTLSAETNIYAPAAGEIATSHYACEYGHKMDYKIELANGDSYLVQIRNAKCWYCCAKKPVPDDGRYTATAGTLMGQAMGAGDMLCVGMEGTTITLVHNIGN